MSALIDLLTALDDGDIDLVDLTAPLSAQTPVLRLPEQFGQASRFTLTEVSRYDDRGPAWYWNTIETSEHTGTHLDVPVHWVTGRTGSDVAGVPVGRLVRPAVVLDLSARVAENPDFLLEIEHIQGWEADHGPLPDGGWLLYRTGWDARAADEEHFLNDGRTPGISVDCARWLAERTPIIGVGVETVGTDAGAAHSFDPPFPCHHHLLGRDRYGLTQLRNLAALPPTGTVLIVAPLPIVNGSGSPCRVLALAPRRPRP
nr:cyclase family protein [Micromonospora sp. DSM 115978]